MAQTVFATVSPAQILAPSKAGLKSLPERRRLYSPSRGRKASGMKSADLCVRVGKSAHRSNECRPQSHPSAPSTTKWWTRSATVGLSERIRQFDRVPRLRRFGSAVLFTKGLTLAHGLRARPTGKSTAERRPLSRGTEAKMLPRFPGHPRRTSASATHRRCFKESRFRSRNREGIKRRGRRDTSEQTVRHRSQSAWRVGSRRRESIRRCRHKSPARRPAASARD